MRPTAVKILGNCLFVEQQKYAEDYTKALEDKGRFSLTIWPDHCIVSMLVVGSKTFLGLLSY
jgi:hypothetical protein